MGWARQSAIQAAVSARLRSSLRPRATLHVLLALSASFLIVGCAQTVSSLTTPATPTVTAASTSAATLSPPAAPVGWTIIARLGNTGPDVVMSGTSFVAQKPFQVLVRCQGAGTLTISVTAPGTSTTQTSTCGSQATNFGVDEPQPAIGQSVQVSVTAEPAVVWAGVIITQQ